MKVTFASDDDTHADDIKIDPAPPVKRSISSPSRMFDGGSPTRSPSKYRSRSSPNRSPWRNSPSRKFKTDPDLSNRLLNGGLGMQDELDLNQREDAQVDIFGVYAANFAYEHNDDDADQQRASINSSKDDRDANSHKDEQNRHRDQLQHSTTPPSDSESISISRSRRCAYLIWIFGLFKNQLKVMVPVSAFLITFQIAVLKSTPNDLGAVIGGLVATIIGLSLFMLGLEMGIMPLGEAMGKHLPNKTSLGLMLLLVFVLGVGCTFAEPAVGALQIAGSLIDPAMSPYLWLLLMDPRYNSALIIAIALGVGLASLIGTLRTVRAWSLPLIITISVLSCISLTIAIQFSPAAEVVGIAWDSGAVTTGCVTVPLVLALGNGIMSTTRRDGSGPNGADPNPLDGFGIVTLASLFPVCFVLMLGLAVGATMSVDDILELQVLALNNSTTTTLAATTSNTASALNLMYTNSSANLMGTNFSDDVEVLVPELEVESSWFRTPWLELFLAFRAITPLVLFLIFVFKLILREPFPRVSCGPVPFRINNLAPWYGVFLAFIGLCIFNIGLSYGLSALGAEVGAALPRLFMEIDDKPALMSKDGGLTVAALFVWLLGLGATLAEPALNQLGITTEHLTGGEFRRVLVLGSVASGVSVGVMLGALKLVLHLQHGLFYMLYIGYSIALSLTFVSSYQYICVAWDSAGVTTGAITVPLVLAIGLGLGDAVGATDAFGLLAMASVCPIISVLVTGLVVAKMYKVEVKTIEGGVSNVQGTRDLTPSTTTPTTTPTNPNPNTNTPTNSNADATTNTNADADADADTTNTVTATHVTTTSTQPTNESTTSMQLVADEESDVFTEVPLHGNDASGQFRARSFASLTRDTDVDDDDHLANNDYDHYKHIDGTDDDDDNDVDDADDDDDEPRLRLFRKGSATEFLNNAANEMSTTISVAALAMQFKRVSSLDVDDDDLDHGVIF